MFSTEPSTFHFSDRPRKVPANSRFSVVPLSLMAVLYHIRRRICEYLQNTTTNVAAFG